MPLPAHRAEEQITALEALSAETEALHKNNFG
jgi:hypothetical protein